ncbi:MAG: fumarylacetoacetate hydrolase family protein [Candidatus Omnitrophica bacterium]|nr:fumarylacetoacetate hydrolase family protein [Candidatus Omnitrophota bacterium]
MKIGRFSHRGEIYTGIVEGGSISVNGQKNRTYDIGDIKLLSPVLPSKIICVGLNYKDHASELGMNIPEEPVIFMKPSTALIGPNDCIVRPGKGIRVDHEAELAIVVGKPAKNIEPEDASGHILGYTCLNDITARDIQKKDGQWTRCKSFDTFCPVGPWVETEIDISDLRVRALVNGVIKQDSSTRELIFGIDYIVSFISKIMTLLPGDIIATGTPPGVGPLSDGDVVAVEIDGIGKLTNYFKGME